MKLWAMDHGINWDWFALIETHSDGSATVLREGRLHKWKDEQGGSIIGAFHKASGANRYSIRDVPVEFGQPRMADGVSINGHWFSFVAPVGRWSFLGIDNQPEAV